VLRQFHVGGIQRASQFGLRGLQPFQGPSTL
jgi:hypothetical protein